MARRVRAAMIAGFPATARSMAAAKVSGAGGGDTWPAPADVASSPHDSHRAKRTARVCGSPNERQMTVHPVMVRSSGQEHDVCRGVGLMLNTSRGGLVAAFVMVVAGLGAAAEHYAKVAEIKIGGAGAFDYLTVDSASKRLYVTHGTEIVVIDLATNAIVGRIANTPRVHGIAIAANGRGFTSNGGENKVGIVDLKTLQTSSKVETGLNPDAILYEPKQKEIYALNHTGRSATVIDAASGNVT